MIKKNKKRVNKNINYLFIMMIVSLVSVFIGMLSGALTMYTYQYKNTEEVETNENIQSITDMYNKILNEYYGGVDEEELANAAINGMTSILDVNTSYFSEGETISFNNKLNGEFRGLGVEAGTVDDGIIIVRTLDDSPAKEAGLQTGDIITAYNGKSMSGKTAQDLTYYISTETSDSVVLTILRDGNSKDYNIVLRTITVNNVRGEIIKSINSNIGYIDIDMFSANSASQFQTELEKIESEGISSLIIDVRSNSGGYLDQVSKILEMLLKKDSKMYSIKTNTDVFVTYDTTDENRDYKIVILTDSLSASASEILTAGLKDNLGAIQVGTKTYGKGSAQEVSEVKTGGMIKITTKVWLTPNDICIDGVGISPDYEVALTETYYNNPTKENDSQLQKAIELLNE